MKMRTTIMAMEGKVVVFYKGFNRLIRKQRSEMEASTEETIQTITWFGRKGIQKEED